MPLASTVGCFHSRPGHYSKLHGLQNFQSSTHADAMMSHTSGNRGRIIDRIRSSLTEPGHVTSDVTGMERISSGGSLSQLDSSSSTNTRAQSSNSSSSNSNSSNSSSQDVEFYSVNGLAINRMVEHAPTLSSYASNSAANSAIRHGIHSRHKRGGGAAGTRQNLFPVSESGDASSDSTAAASTGTSAMITNGSSSSTRWGGVSLDDSASPVTAVKTVTHWGSPAEKPLQKNSFAQNSFAHHQTGEPLLGPSTTVLRHLYFQQGRHNAQASNGTASKSSSNSSVVKKRAGAAAPMMIANGMSSMSSSAMHAAAAEPDALLGEFQRQRARSGSVGLG
jgi:hypothetical protein